MKNKNDIYFEKSHRWALVFVFVLVLLRIFLPSLMTPDSHPFEEREIVYRVDTIYIEKTTKSSHESTKAKYTSKKKYDSNSIKSVKPQIFDPNNASVDELLAIGFSKKVAFTIRKYLKKGGKFYKPDDLSKIFGVDENTLKKVMPYVKIDGYKPSFKQKRVIENEIDETLKSYDVSIVKKEIYNIDVNLAVAKELMKIKGIGPVLSKRIIKYRNKIGGFYDLEQIKEVYGFTDSLFLSIKSFLNVEDNKLKKILINEVTFKTLLKHPYINYDQVKLLFNYKKQHGNYNSIKEIKSSLAFNESELNMIEPYLKFNSDSSLLSLTVID